VLRDITERVIIAGKGRFDRALNQAKRKAAGLPHEATLTNDEFMAATLDLWQLDPEQAHRVGHPAPFPVTLPERLIHLFTYRDDVVLDPFMGSGSALVAARLAGRRGVGYDTDAAYVQIARERLAQTVTVSAAPVEGTLQTVARTALTDAGFRVDPKAARIRGTGITPDLAARDRNGATWYVELAGGFTTGRNGQLRADDAWRIVGRAHLVRQRHPEARFLVLTPALPKSGSEADLALRATAAETVADVIAVGPDAPLAGLARLAAYAHGQPLTIS